MSLLGLEQQQGEKAATWTLCLNMKRSRFIPQNLKSILGIPMLRVVVSEDIPRSVLFWRMQSSSCNNSSDAVELDKEIKRASEKLKEADALVITAGAGMGVDSGFPDFRGTEGFWKAYPPIKRLGLSLPEMSTPSWFINDPAFAWGFFGHRLQLYRRTPPHKGFDILLDWAKSRKDGYFVFTSNVDGHFQKAGFPEDRIVECHGSINYLQTIQPIHNDIWPHPLDNIVEVDESTLRAKEPLPEGPPDVSNLKKMLARPNVLMFGDWSWVSWRTDEQNRRFDEFLNTLNRKKSSLVVVEIGAGLAVPTVRMASEGLVRQKSRGTLIRINPQEAHVPSKTHISLPMKGLEALNRIKYFMDGSDEQ